MAALKTPLKGIVVVSPGGLAKGGGIGSVTRLMHAWLAEHHPGVRVDVLDPRGDRGIQWSIPRTLYAMLQLIYLRAWFGSEVIHLQVSERMSFPRKGMLLQVARVLGMRIVLHHHGAELISSYAVALPPMRRVIRWMVRNADMNIVLGEPWRHFLVNLLGAPRERVVVHYNAGQDLRSVARVSAHPWKFLIAANLMPRKGISELLKAVHQLAATGAPVRLTLAGGGAIERYRGEAEALGIAERCEFTGWVSGPQLRALFEVHGAFVLPSYQEGLPMAIIEALSAGLPVVATPVGSIPELLEDGKTCLFAKPGDVAGLADALGRVASDPALAETLATNGRVLYDAHFDIEHYMNRLMRLYESTLHAGAADELVVASSSALEGRSYESSQYPSSTAK